MFGKNIFGEMFGALGAPSGIGNPVGPFGICRCLTCVTARMQAAHLADVRALGGLNEIGPTKRYDAPLTIEEIVPVRPRATAVRPPALWQWKNGRTAPLFEEDFPIEGTFKAWDRSLGCYVVYADK